MIKPEQLSLFTDEFHDENTESLLTAAIDLGTFKDSMRAPIHSWFRYPAGYSYKFVDGLFDKFNINSHSWVYDPFSGTGTTLVSAKQKNINAYGVEAHSFVHWVADVKLYWDYNLDYLETDISKVITRCQEYLLKRVNEVDIIGIFPELVYKCYHLQDLKELYLIREFLLQHISDIHLQNLLKLALTNTLRSAAAAGTGWPYIAPNKNTGDKPAKGAKALFIKVAWKMFADLRTVKNSNSGIQILNVLGDSRKRQTLPDCQIDLALTSPPYLNNYDYADRTRLETYFWGITKNWKEITEQFRDKLMVAATTQVIRKNYQVETALSNDLSSLSPKLYESLQDAIMQLAELRTKKGGKKDYDLMVALYFNDILQIIQETYRVLKPGGKFCLVLGDSAPYGVHIQTENAIGQIGMGMGFSDYKYTEFRTRGGKWKNNPQRHNIQLREGLVILTK